MQVVELLRAVTTCRMRCIAFAMGLHERLGAGSRVGALDPGVVRMVLGEEDDKSAKGRKRARAGTT